MLMLLTFSSSTLQVQAAEAARNFQNLGEFVKEIRMAVEVLVRKATLVVQHITNLSSVYLFHR
jgi:preprotein translocase subunit SecY